MPPPIRLSLADVGGPIGSPGGVVPLSLEDVGGPITGAPAASVEAPDIGGTLGADLRGEWTRGVAVNPQLLELGVTAQPPPLAPIPFLQRAAGVPVTAPAAAPPPAPAALPPVAGVPRVPFLQSLATGQPTEAFLPPPAPAQAPSAPAARPLGRLVGPRRPAAAQAPAEPAASSTGQAYQDPGLIDAMTRSQGSSWQAPQETPFDRERRAIDIARQLEQQRAEMVARQAMDAADAEEAYRQRQAEHERQRAQAEGVARDSYQRAVDRLQQMQIDPGRYYRRAGVVGMLGNAIAVGLGAMGQALGGGPNVALDMMQNAIDQDLRAQEQDIATASATADQRRGLLAEVRNDFTSREAALEAARAIALREAAARVEAEAAMQGSAEAQANARVMRDRLLTQSEQAAAEAQRAEAQAVLELATQAAVLRRRNAIATQEEIRAQRMAGAGQGPARPRPVTSAQVTAARDLMAAGIDGTQASQLAGLPVVLPQAPLTTEQRSTFDALDSTLRSVEDRVARGEAQGDVAGVGVFDNAVAQWLPSLQSEEAASLRADLLSALDLFGRLRSGGAISEPEEQRFARILQGAGTERDLRVGLQTVRRELDARLRLGGRAGSAQASTDAALERAGVRRVE